AEELARIAGKRLDVAPLSFGVKRIEGQGTLPRAAHAREDDQAVTGQVEVDVAEIMFPGTPNDDRAVVHAGCSTCQLLRAKLLVYGCQLVRDKDCPQAWGSVMPTCGGAAANTMTVWNTTLGTWAASCSSISTISLKRMKFGRIFGCAGQARSGGLSRG